MSPTSKTVLVEAMAIEGPDCMTVLIAGFMMVVALGGGLIFGWPLLTDIYKKASCSKPDGEKCICIDTAALTPLSLWTLFWMCLLVWMGPNIWSMIRGMFSGGGGGGYQ